MIGVLTWPAYGTWLAGPSHGWLEAMSGADWALPEPDQVICAQRRKSLKWPVVQLNAAQRDVAAADLVRIAGLREFELCQAIVSEDHAHLLMSTDAADDAALHRLIQLIKGATARALSVAAGDRPALDALGHPLPHQKWWSRQYVLQRLIDDAAAHRASQLLRAHKTVS
jgi:REP element-mobilizing transposase RayT